MTVYAYDPKRKLYLVSVMMDNKPGTFGNLANLLAVRGMNMLDGYFGARADEEKAVVGFFLESKNPKVDEKWLKEFIETSIGVSDVEVKGSVEGFLSDSLAFPLVWNTGDRAVLMRVDHVKFIFDAARKAMGASGDETIYQQGFLYGKAAWENLIATFRPKTKEGVAEILQIYNAVGWGRLTLHDLDLVGMKANVRMTDGFECASASTGKPSSHFIRGHIAGAMSAYFRVDVRAVETKCVSASDQYCEFEVSR